MYYRQNSLKVFINGEYHGLFIAVEQVDGRFTANRFPENGNGNLYKEVWPGIDVQDDTISEALKTYNDDDIADISDFLAFRKAVATAEEADFADTMTSFVDFDYLARYMVVDRAIHNFDGVLALYEEFASKNHNYYWYHEEDSNRFTLIPWDMDKVFMVPEPLFYNESSTVSELILPCSPANVPNWNELIEERN